MDKLIGVLNDNSAVFYGHYLYQLQRIRLVEDKITMFLAEQMAKEIEIEFFEHFKKRKDEK